ncbi:LPS-assembly protein [Bisgaardia hudsonensis]|uniref:LPS-assembly protein LptD n=1 Tax=Bisgaardia hudsonensis TaxID=109472 RepID=A0A4R2MUN5_9PAST|nr:LPS assembly protein LptD [Bisgaardia hudsonensis]TCP12410.1 LPS-assembly protein [Bisgaardia hudsonensis]
MKNSYSLLFISIFTVLYTSQSIAKLEQQCLLHVPHFTGNIVKTDPNSQPVYIVSDSAEFNYPINAIYRGNVDIQQGNRQLNTDYAEVKQIGNAEALERFAYINSPFNYKDNLIQLSGRSARLSLNDKEIAAKGIDYQFVDKQGRGTATSVEVFDNHRIMENATFSTCLANDNSWSIESIKMRQHIKEEYAEMWHARFKIHDVPIFYTPYLQLPTGDRRRSGLLIPSIGHSRRDGSWFYLPFYWNIASNFDATISPKYMSHRGWQLNGEFRYLVDLGLGQIASEYLPNDRYNPLLKNDDRYLFYWNHNSRFLQNWRLNIDYTKVSDKYYFSHFDSKYGRSTDGYAEQSISAVYYQPNYNFTISARQFQVFDNVNIGPYRALPDINFNYYKNGLLNGLFDFKLYSQAIRFDNNSNLMPTAWRFHLEPSLVSSIANKYGSINLETKLYATHYQQKKGRDSQDDVQKSVNRVLPQIKVNFQTLLAKKNSFREGYTQTIEPRIQYLYRPYKDQSNIGTELKSNYVGFGYDSSLIQQDYYSLFSDRRYSGLDRIASANQFTLGATTRLYNSDGDERFNLSLGQIYYVRNSRIDENIESSTNNATSAWALETNWRINQDWNWHGSYQYSPNLKKTSLANSILEYNPSGNNIIQLSYRYASKEYIDQNSKSNNYGQDIQQIGMVAAWDVNDHWALVSHYYHDLAFKKSLESYLGVKYNTCCWSVGVGAKRYVVDRFNPKDDEVKYDNSFNIKLELQGFSGHQNSGVENMLREGKLPYLKLFSLH